MRWYLPSWNGDIRAEQAPDWEDRTRITIIEPTTDELLTLGRLERASSPAIAIAHPIMAPAEPLHVEPAVSHPHILRNESGSCLSAVDHGHG